MWRRLRARDRSGLPTPILKFCASIIDIGNTAVILMLVLFGMWPNIYAAGYF